MLKNFLKVDESVYRGGRPDASSALDLAPFKSVVNLEGDDVAGTEALMLQSWKLTLKFLWCPISLGDVYVESFPDALLHNLVDVIMTDLPKPVYVHCQHGKDRTGLVIAAYRMRLGVSPADAFADAVEHGYLQHLNFGLNKNFERLGVKLPPLDI